VVVQAPDWGAIGKSVLKVTMPPASTRSVSHALLPVQLASALSFR
jgi:hypothetical protein